MHRVFPYKKNWKVPVTINRFTWRIEFRKSTLLNKYVELLLYELWDVMKNIHVFIVQ